MAARKTFKEQFYEQMDKDQTDVREMQVKERFQGIFNNITLYEKHSLNHSEFIIRPTLANDRSYGNTHIPYKVANLCYKNHDIVGYCKPPRVLRWFSDEGEAVKVFQEAVSLTEKYQYHKDSTLLIEVHFNWNQHRYGFHVYSLESGFGDSLRQEYKKIGEIFSYENNLSSRLSMLLNRSIPNFREDILCIEFNMKTNLISENDLI